MGSGSFDKVAYASYSVANHKSYNYSTGRIDRGQEFKAIHEILENFKVYYYLTGLLVQVNDEILSRIFGHKTSVVLGMHILRF